MLGKTGLFAHEMISFRCRQMSYMKLSCMDVFRSHLLDVVLKNKKNKNTPMMTLNLFIFEKNFEFLMKEHESLRGINQNNLTYRLAWSGT